MNIAALAWFAVLVFSLILESSTVAVVGIWFAFGALAAMIASLCHAWVWLQLLLFFAVSCLLLAALRPITRKYLNPRLTKTNVDSVIGTPGIVLSRIDNIRATGQVKLGSMEWSARSTSGDPIEVGTRIKADRIEGVKVFVSACEE